MNRAWTSAWVLLRVGWGFSVNCWQLLSPSPYLSSFHFIPFTTALFSLSLSPLWLCVSIGPSLSLQTLSLSLITSRVTVGGVILLQCLDRVFTWILVVAEASDQLSFTLISYVSSLIFLCFFCIQVSNQLSLGLGISTVAIPWCYETPGEKWETCYSFKPHLPFISFTFFYMSFHFHGFL